MRQIASIWWSSSTSMRMEPSAMQSSSNYFFHATTKCLELSLAKSPILCISRSQGICFLLRWRPNLPFSSSWKWTCTGRLRRLSRNCAAEKTFQRTPWLPPLTPGAMVISMRRALGTFLSLTRVRSKTRIATPLWGALTLMEIQGCSTVNSSMESLLRSLMQRSWSKRPLTSERNLLNWEKASEKRLLRWQMGRPRGTIKTRWPLRPSRRTLRRRVS